MKITAAAHPEKRLFISLLTRDIGLADAFLDIIDNSINAALRAIGLSDGDSEEYLRLLDADRKPLHNIRVDFSPEIVSISDDCGGISANDAKTTVFVFGAAAESHLEDRLSVYGIGLKRAMFKLGNKIYMTSEHADGGFDLDLDVQSWQKKTEQNWSFEIVPRPAADQGSTTLIIKDLYEDVKARLSDPSFETELRTRISRAYSFFISSVVKIKLNGTLVEADVARISENKASASFEEHGVSIAISAGLAIPDQSGKYTASLAGWDVYCNGRAVIVYDKSTLTGWGLEGYLPSFQPKHRPFVGNVFSTSGNPEKLPWTTTKLGVNADNIVWQKAVRRMAEVGRPVIKFLDAVYNEEGTTITRDELSDAIGGAERVRPSVIAESRVFLPPKRKQDTYTSIQYRVDKERLARVKRAIGSASMSNGDVGHYTFEYFERSEVE